MNLRMLEEQLGKVESEEAVSNDRLSEAIGAIAAETQSYEAKMTCARMMQSLSSTIDARPVKSVGLFCTRLGNGGIEKVVTLLSSIFIDIGLKVIVITNDELSDDSYKLPEGVHHEKLCPIEPGDSMRATAAMRAAALLDIIERYDIDTFMSHTWLDGGQLYDLAVCHARNVRFVMCVHGVFSFAELLPDAMRDSFALVPLICRLCDSVVTLTDMNAYFFSKFCSRTYPIPNPIGEEFEAFTCQERGKSRTVAEVLWVGRFDVLKRPEEAIEAFARVLVTLPEAHLTLVGKSEDGMYETLLAEKCADLGVEDSVTFAGYTTDVAQFYKQADVLLSTTEVEGFCMVFLEASAARLPIVMYRLPYLPFDRSDGVIGVPIGDVDALADSVLQVLQDDELRARMEEGSARCYESFSSYDYKAAWQEVFDGLETAPTQTPYPLEDSMWDMLFDHFVRGSQAIARSQSSLAGETWRNAERQTRQEYESSSSYRIGRALTSLPRLLLGRR